MANNGKYRNPAGGRNDYETDPEFFKILNYEFNFDLDAAASHTNSKCDIYYTEKQDSLKIEWYDYANTIWLNPPYSRDVIDRFMEKCVEQSDKGCTVVTLVHATPELNRWYDYVWGYASEIRYPRGRLNFWLGNNKNTSDLPHAVIIYRPRMITGITHQMNWDWRDSYYNIFGPIPYRDKNTREILYFTTPDKKKVSYDELDEDLIAMIGNI